MRLFHLLSGCRLFCILVSKEEEHNIIGLPQIQINKRKFVAKILMTKYAI